MSMLVQTYILCSVNVLHAPSAVALHPVVLQELCSIGLVSLAPPQASLNLIRQEESNKDRIALVPDRWDRFCAYGAKVYGLINRVVNLADEDYHVSLDEVETQIYFLDAFIHTIDPLL